MQQPVQEENPNQANTAWTSLNFEVQSIWSICDLESEVLKGDSITSRLGLGSVLWLSALFPYSYN
jgi:hypothetical protein